jgi:predicted nucleic acid-binding protein
VGLVLDSSVVIAAERQGRPVSDFLLALRADSGATEIVLSAISVVELEHGLWRAKTPELAHARRIYLDGVFVAIPVEAFTKEMGQLAAKIDAQARTQGKTIPFADLQIGVTALHLSYEIVTLNVRHFQMIPGLEVRQQR